MSGSQRKFAVMLFNFILLWGAWYVSGYGVMAGRSGNLGRNCLYLTARGFYDQPEIAATTANKMPQVDNCSLVYSFDAWD